MMPRMDGYAFLEAIRTRPEWMYIPFVFLTARKESEDVLKAKNLKAEGFITKPFAPQELVTTVRAWL
jgi:two-component system sensor histidine kinase/response regulator